MARRSEIKARSYLNIFGTALAAVAISGCSGSGGGAPGSEPIAGAPPRTMIIALDTSASARNYHEEMFNRIVRQIAQMPKETKLVIYRFDASPAEVFDGEPMADEAEAGMMLKKELRWSSKTLGTDMASMIRQVDSRLAKMARPVAIDVYTDCGSELMTKQDDAFVASTVQGWDDVEIRFHGVQSGHRERLRSMFGDKEIKID